MFIFSVSPFQSFTTGPARPRICHADLDVGTGCPSGEDLDVLPGLLALGVITESGVRVQSGGLSFWKGKGSPGVDHVFPPFSAREVQHTSLVVASANRPSFVWSPAEWTRRMVAGCGLLSSISPAEQDGARNVAAPLVEVARGCGNNHPQRQPAPHTHPN